MSIVVTCSCTKTYRLPNRYAGKRCRCRDCGRKIAVPPTDAEAATSSTAEKPAKAENEKRARRRKRKDDPSKTTRRLSSQDQEILGERRQIRSSQRTRPVSESMHQLAPMTLSGELSIAPAQPKKAMRAVEKPPTDPKSSKSSKSSKAKKAPTAKAPAKPSKTKVTPKPPESEIVVEAPARKTTAKTAKSAKKAEVAKRAKKNKGKDKKSDKKAQGRRGRASREDDEDARPTGRTRKRAYSLPVVLGIAGVLCLGIGLVIGGLVGSGPKGPDAQVEQRLAHVDGLKASRQWDAAKAELDKLKAELTAAGDEQGVARVRAAAVAVETMVQLTAIEDDEAKLGTLVDYSTNKDAAVRLGVAFELRELAELEDAQRALAALANDSDKRVAEAARHGLVHVGGPLAIPYLGEVIEQTAGSGHKLGDVALERALEIQEPEIAPVLMIALKARASANASVLKAILGRLAEFADPSMKDAVTPFASHADEGVKAAAQAILDSIG